MSHSLAQMYLSGLLYSNSYKVKIINSLPRSTIAADGPSLVDAFAVGETSSVSKSAKTDQDYWLFESITILFCNHQKNEVNQWKSVIANFQSHTIILLHKST